MGEDVMYYPDIISQDEEAHYGKYERMRLQYLKEYQKVRYHIYLLEDKLIKCLNRVDDEANEGMELLAM